MSCYSENIRIATNKTSTDFSLNNIQMKRVYLSLAIIGFILPSILVIQESIETGNILLYYHIGDTIEAMFANRISTIFCIDLFFAVLVFMVWSYCESKKYNIKQVGLIWLLTFLLGLAGGLPLFLYKRECAIDDQV